jgi:receptor protein-tyrosine kinase
MRCARDAETPLGGGVVMEPSRMVVASGEPLGTTQTAGLDRGGSHKVMSGGPYGEAHVDATGQRMGERIGDRIGERLGDLLARRAGLSASQIERVLREQSRSEARFGELAIRLGMVTRKDVEEALARQFGYPRIGDGQAQRYPKLAAAFAVTSPFAEALRALRGQLAQRWFDGSPDRSAMSVVSVDRGDGKSFILSNLAVAFSQLGERTVLVDADLRHPTQHEIFGLPNRMGLSGVLSGRADLSELAAAQGLENLSVLSAGALPPNPQELLGRTNFSRLLNQLSLRYDVILVDTSAAQYYGDALVAARRVGGALLLARAGRTGQGELAQLCRTLSQAGIAVLGSTLNAY